MSATAAELSGTWTGTEDTGEAYNFEFGATDWSITNDTGDDWHQGTYTFNANSEPKHLDLFFTDSADNRFINKTALYIYKIEENTLTLTGGEPGSDYRPSAFSEGDTTRTFVITNEDMETDENSGDTKHSNDEDNVKVYINCFVATVLN